LGHRSLQNAFVEEISVAIKQRVPLYHDWLSDINFRFFCDSFVGYVAVAPVVNVCERALTRARADDR